MTLWARTGIVCRLLLASLLMVFAIGAAAQQTQPDTEQLGKALEYFQGGKYHESLLIFQGLDKRYKLNPRFRAYIGLCYYKEWNYKKAVEYFDRVLPLLGGLAPHELSVYYYAAGESCFQMQQYGRALAYFEKDISVCYNLEKGDVYYRMGLCHMFMKQWQKAYDSYCLSEDFYGKYRDEGSLEARLAQITNMKNGCLSAISKMTDRERSRMLRQYNGKRDDAGDASVENYNPWKSIVIKQLPQCDN